MSTGATVAIIVVIVIIVIAVAVSSATAARRLRLRQRFGPEYHRAVADQQSHRKAEAEVTSRERRVRRLDIRPLTAAARSGYTAQWAGVQAKRRSPRSRVKRRRRLWCGFRWDTRSRRWMMLLPVGDFTTWHDCRLSAGHAQPHRCRRCRKRAAVTSTERA